MMSETQLLAPEELERIIAERIPESRVQVTDLTGTRDHYRVEVISPAFEGKSLVQQHQMVYRAVGDHMTQAVHALQIRTKAPKE
jgi:stress-induced morphogen